MDGKSWENGLNVVVWIFPFIFYVLVKIKFQLLSLGSYLVFSSAIFQTINVLKNT